MNTPNPLVPQGSLQEQSKKKSQVRIIVFSILAIHVVLLTVLMIQGCKPEQPVAKPEIPPLPPLTDTNPPPPPPLPVEPTNLPVLPSNPPVVVPPTTFNPTPPIEVPAASGSEHVIQKGETLAVIAKKYGVSVKAILQANPGIAPTRLKINQKINIPAKPPGSATTPAPTAAGAKPEETVAGDTTVYIVKKGETLTKIAKAHGVSVKAIKAANNLKTDQIKPNQKLKLPVKAAASAPAASAPSVPPYTPPVTTPPVSVPPIAPPAPGPSSP